MRNPKTYSGTAWGEAWLELSGLFLMTWVAITSLLQVHWFIALSMAPFVMLAMLVGVGVVVQLLWLAVVALDRIWCLVGLRKSPLS